MRGRGAGEGGVGAGSGAHTRRQLSRLGDATGQPRRHRIGQALLAGDATHVHPPTGSQRPYLDRQSTAEP
ncbi:FAD-dependent monooxygenase [Streptomyces yunnanensis]|uniref:FAD-dependent monooxygenase n=1 Tax=Streptomyces yunnanensis TaxID=156453 RepID=UPI003B831C8F